MGCIEDIQDRLAQNKQNAIETNQQLIKKIAIMEKVIKELAAESDCPCNYCEYDLPCLEKACDSYVEGIGVYDESGKYIDIKWSCMDFNFGECPKLENTPCHNCLDMGDNFQFKWNGTSKGE